MANLEMMRSYLDRVAKGDFARAEEYYTDDITVHVSGWKTVSGLAEWRAAMAEMMGQVDAMEVEPHDLLVSDDHAVVLDAWKVTKGDRVEHVNHVVVYHTTDDKITEMWVVAEDQKLMDSLMG